jgi:hypothetical protein
MNFMNTFLEKPYNISEYNKINGRREKMLCHQDGHLGSLGKSKRFLTWKKHLVAKCVVIVTFFSIAMQNMWRHGIYMEIRRKTIMYILDEVSVKRFNFNWKRICMNKNLWRKKTLFVDDTQRAHFFVCCCCCFFMFFWGEGGISEFFFCKKT